MLTSGAMPPAVATAACASAQPMHSRWSAAAACSRERSDVEPSSSTSGCTPPSARTVDWLLSSIERESDQSAYAFASGAPPLTKAMRSAAAPACAIASVDAGLSCTSRHSEDAALDMASRLPEPSNPTSGAVICAWFCTLAKPRAESAFAACLLPRSAPSASKLTRGATPPAEAMLTFTHEHTSR